MPKIKKDKRKKLTDKQRKKIIADYVETGNYSETARINGVAVNTVKTIVLSDKNTANKCMQKKEENIRDILEYMDSIATEQKEIIDLSLKAIKKKLEKPDAFTSVKDIATVYGVIFDKAIKLKEMKYKQNSENDSADEGVVIINDCPKVEKEEDN